MLMISPENKEWEMKETLKNLAKETCLEVGLWIIENQWRVYCECTTNCQR